VPKAVDHDVRRAELVAATAKVIAGEGISAATMRRIAEAAGCTTGRVTHYFTSKDEMLLTTLQEVHHRVGDRMLGHLRNGEPVGALRSVLLEALPLDEARRLEWRVWLAFFGYRAANHALQVEQERRYRGWRTLLERLVGGTATAWSVDERNAMVDLIIATIEGLGTQAVLDPAKFSPPRVLRVVDLLVETATAEPAASLDHGCLRLDDTAG
jgi:AcrR family transcriptional regulator